MNARDDATLAFYDREAASYAARMQDAKLPHLQAFLDRLAAGARILELGCGGGRDAEQMIARGFDVDPTDGSPGLAAQAERRLGRSVRLMRFEDLDAEAAYDAVWANASLLHAPMAALPGLLARIHRALVPAGLFFASYKSGDGEGRDSLGRYYNFPSGRALRAAYEEAAPWTALEFGGAKGGGYDGVDRDWLFCTATR